jgi:hypothetical protein
MHDKLAIPTDELRTLIQNASELVATYYGKLHDRPVLSPTTSQALRDTLCEPLPLAGTSFDSLLVTLRDVVF